MRKKGLILAAVASAVAALAALAAATAAGPAEARRGAEGVSLNGAGATFPAPLIAVWQQEYEKRRGVKVNYNPIGSGGGIAAITARTVDFGASDAPLTPDQFSACKGCMQLPWVLSATAVMYNLSGVSKRLRINGRTIADIYLGKITKWNDPRLRALNKGASLPDKEITPVFRSDGSGTTFNFTDYLSTVSAEFRSRVGNSTSVNWPKGVGGRGSSGLSGIVSRTDGAIGYADVAYAKANHLGFFAVQNRSGKYTLPGLRGIKAASLADRQFSSTNALSIVNPPKGKKFLQAYPICTYSYVLLPLKSEKAVALRAFVAWAVTTGQAFGPRLIFQPLPSYVVKRVRAQLPKVTA
jgi:phosphate transport system substrate-binding protein